MKFIIGIIITLAILYFLNYEGTGIVKSFSQFFDKLNHFQGSVYILSAIVYLFGGWFWIDSLNLMGEAQTNGEAWTGDGYIDEYSAREGSGILFKILAGTAIVDLVVLVFN